MPFVGLERSTFQQEKLNKAAERIKSSVWDTEAWSVLLRDAQENRIEDARDFFEQLVSQFPLSGNYWRIYIQQELKAKNFERVEKLFQRCLIKILNIDLWKLYLQYIRETKGRLPTFKEKMAQAYDFALDKMGLDFLSYPIWADYVVFLRGTHVTGSYAESQKITATRRIYQKAIVTPMLGIETIWRDYCLYENSINPLIAKKFTEDRSRDYMNARRVAKEYEAITKGINRTMASVPPQNSPEEYKQVELWKRYIQWEKENPMHSEDLTLVTKRVMFAYEQCLLCLGHHPDVWYEAASYLEQSSRLLIEKGDQSTAKVFADEAAAMYERAIGVLRESAILYFAYADYEEGRGRFEKVHAIYKKLLAIEEIDPTLSYIQYMKFARRKEGIKSARTVFKAAREDTRTRWHAYVAAAHMEYFCSKDRTIGHKILELGMKKFSAIPEYIMMFSEYMGHINDDNNSRVLFERALSSGQIPHEKTRLIWSSFLEFESNVGDLNSITKVEKRRFNAFSQVEEFKGKETALLIDRYKFLDLFPCTDAELRSLGYAELARAQLVHFHHSGLGGSVGGMLAPDWRLAGAGGSSGGHEALRVQFPRPDVQQMLPFKPKAYARTGSHPVSGGEFPPPPVASHLLKLIPPPNCYHGPFVRVEALMELILNCQLPEELLRPASLADGERPIDPGTAISIEASTMGLRMQGVSRKRKAAVAPAAGGTGNATGNSVAGTTGNTNASGVVDDDDDVAAHSVSVMQGGDVYRNRQLAKRQK